MITDLPFVRQLRGSFKPADPIFLVGGAIRDHLMGLPVEDLDLVCRHGIKTGKAIADQFGFGLFILDRERDICRLIDARPDGSQDHIDISGFRGDGIEADLLGRDLTINAIAFDIFSELVIDPLSGARDIREKQLVACSSTSISDDPLRILRVARFANAFKFRVGSGLLEQVKAEKEHLAKISKERIRDEFMKILTGPDPHIGIQILDKFGALEFILPELLAAKGIQQSPPHVQDVWAHTLSVLKRASEFYALVAKPYDEGGANADVFSGLLVLKLGSFRQNLIDHFSKDLPDQRPRVSSLLLAAALHDIGKPDVQTEEDGRVRFIGHDAYGAAFAKSWMKKYNFSAQEVDLVTIAVREHMRFHALVSRMSAGREITDRHIYKYFQSAGKAGIELILLGLADFRATSEHALPQQHWRTALDVAALLLDGYFNRFDLVIEPALLLDGSALTRDFNLPPGPLIGKILARLKEEQASGSVQTLDSANQLVDEILNAEKGD